MKRRPRAPPTVVVVALPASEAVGAAHAGIAHRRAAGRHMAGQAPIEAAVGVARDHEVIPLAGCAQIPVQLLGMAGTGHFDIPRRVGTVAMVGAREEDRLAEAEPGGAEVGSRPETRHRAEAHRMDAGTRTEARTFRLRRGGYRGANGQPRATGLVGLYPEADVSAPVVATVPARNARGR